MKYKISAVVIGFLLGLGLCAAAAQILLPNGQQQFLDNNGAPLASGQVFFYVPSTTTPLTTYQNQSLTTPNTNPVILNAAGRAIIWGTGNYREVVYDQNGNLIWDQITSGVGSVTPGLTPCQSCTANYLLYTDGTKIQQEAAATPGQGGKPTNRYTNFTAMSTCTLTAPGAFQHCGYGSTWTITPSSTGNVRVRITGTLENFQSNITYGQMRYGTGSAPTVGTAATGTVGNGNTVQEQASAAASTALGGAAFEFELTVPIGTSYWFDMTLNASSSNPSFIPASVIIEEF